MRRVAMLGVLLAGLAGLAIGWTPAAAASLSYVSLGDSYTSGPLILPPALSAPLDCAQSARNYPHLTAAALGLSLTDVSCSGATTEDLTTTSQYPDQPPQVDALSPATQVVSVGIGGNDNGLFLDTLISCGAEDLAIPFGTPCKDTYGERLSQEIAADGPVVGAALQQIRLVSPSARVFVVGYPDILPQSGNCWPTVPLTTGDVAYLNGVEQELNSMLADEARVNGDSYLDTYTPSIGHDACQPQSIRYVEPPLPESDAFPVHPNERGMQADAAELQSAMVASGIS